MIYPVRFPSGAGPHQVRPIRVLGAVNVDWEDIAYHDGKLYVIESDQSRRSGVICEIPEPDPLGPARVRQSARYRYAYPGGRRSNTETAFFFAGRLVLVPKTTPAELYRFDRPLSPTRRSRPRFVGRLRGSNTMSVARVSPDATSLVLVANHQQLFIFQTSLPARDLRDFVSRRGVRRPIAPGANVEGGDVFLLGQCKLVLAAENRALYRMMGPAPAATTPPSMPGRHAFRPTRRAALAAHALSCTSRRTPEARSAREEVALDQPGVQFRRGFPGA